jgi:ankyrin repeat protein
MPKINPKLLLLLIGALALVAYLKISNPNKQYSRQVFWETATVEVVYSIPEEALLPGNKNGPVLMWAAAGTDDPKVIAALVQRGADVNESDPGVFSGTPLSAAAAYASNPEIVDELIRLGADVNKVVGSNKKTPLIIAAELNKNPEIAESLIRNGANVAYRDLTGLTALEQAKRFGNTAVAKVLEAHAD